MQEELQIKTVYLFLILCTYLCLLYTSEFMIKRREVTKPIVLQYDFLKSNTGFKNYQKRGSLFVQRESKIKKTFTNILKICICYLYEAGTT